MDLYLISIRQHDCAQHLHALRHLERLLLLSSNFFDADPGLCCCFSYSSLLVSLNIFAAIPKIAQHDCHLPLYAVVSI